MRIRDLFRKSTRLGYRLYKEVRRKPSRLEEVRRLLDEGADVNYYIDRTSVLNWAVRLAWCDVAITKILLERGANVDGTQRPGLTPPLLDATHNNNEVRVRLLIDAGADLNASENEQTALPQLTLWAEAELVEYMLVRGADPNAGKHRNGCCTLHMAVLGGRTELIPLYLKYGADMATRNTKGLTPLQYAIHLRDEAKSAFAGPEQLDAVIALLRDAGAEE